MEAEPEALIAKVLVVVAGVGFYAAAEASGMEDGMGGLVEDDFQRSRGMCKQDWIEGDLRDLVSSEVFPASGRVVPKRLVGVTNRMDNQRGLGNVRFKDSELFPQNRKHQGEFVGSKEGSQNPVDSESNRVS